MRQMVGGGKLVFTVIHMAWNCGVCLAAQSGPSKVEWDENVFGGLSLLTSKHVQMFVLSKHCTQLCSISQNHLLLFFNEQINNFGFIQGLFNCISIAGFEVAELNLEVVVCFAHCVC